MTALRRPLTLVGMSVAAFGVLLISAIATRSPTCGSGSDWFGVLLLTLGPLSAIAAFMATYQYGTSRRSVAAGIGAALFAILWTVVGTVILFAVSFPSGCFS